MPLTAIQKNIAKILSINRSPESHLAGGAAIHLNANTQRFSFDLDYFHDSIESVAIAFDLDMKRLSNEGYEVEILVTQPGFIQVLISKNNESTKVEWSHDTAWRFLPVIKDESVGYQLHPIDLAVNKVLALIGRSEARDLIDTLFVHKQVLSLGALCWAAAGKDPGFTPMLILDLIRRRGIIRQEDLKKLNLVENIDLAQFKQDWLNALQDAEQFIRSRPHDELGCLYYSANEMKFIGDFSAIETSDAKPHYGKPYGIKPAFIQ